MATRIETFLLANFEPAADRADADAILSTLDIQKKLEHIFPADDMPDLYQILTDNDFLMTDTTKQINPKWLMKLK